MWFAGSGVALAGEARFDEASSLPTASPMLVDAAALRLVAADTLRYIAAYPEGSGPAVAASTKLTLDQRQQTLHSLTSSSIDLNDRAAVERCYALAKWTPDSDRWKGKIRLTRYLVYSVNGSDEATPEYNHALYAVPNDEEGLSLGDAEKRKAALDRFRYTRQDIAAGVFREGGGAAGRARPLVWLSHENHEQAILQGTIAVQTATGRRLFNVDRDNGIPYDRRVKATKEQRRYWYFRETDAVRGYGASGSTKISLQPNVSVAGDVDNLGLGTLLALEAADGLRLVIVSDTGGAFQPNLHQLDLYTGVYPDRPSFDRATGGVGDVVTGWVLTLRPGVVGCGPVVE
jgi:membrane-bound lytic murein transglycosylase